MFTEDDARFVKEYMQAERKLHGTIIYKFYSMEELTYLPMTVTNPSSAGLPTAISGNADAGDSFVLIGVGTDDGVPWGCFEISSVWHGRGLVYKATLYFTHAAEYLSGFREFVIAAGFGRERRAPIAYVKTEETPSIAPIDELNNLDSIFGSW